MERLFVLPLICLILGCAGAPIGYGGTFEVSYSDENMIMFTYDSDLTNVGKMTPYNSEENNEMGQRMNKVYTIAGYISVLVALYISLHFIINGI